MGHIVPLCSFLFLTLGNIRNLIVLPCLCEEKRGDPWALVEDGNQTRWQPVEQKGQENTDHCGQQPGLSTARHMCVASLQLKNSVTNVYSKISKQCEAAHLRFEMASALVKSLKRKWISCRLPVKQHVCRDETHLCVTLLAGAWVGAQETPPPPRRFWLHLQRAEKSVLPEVLRHVVVIAHGNAITGQLLHD